MPKGKSKKVVGRKELLEKCSRVVSVEELLPGTRFKDKLSEFMPPEKVEAIMANVEQLTAHRIVYKTKDGHKVVGFVVEPKEIAAMPRPTIIWNRGGSNDFGKILPSDVWVKLGRMALWDFAVVATQYSGSDGSEGKDEMGGQDLNDVLTLRDIIDEYPYTDASRICMFGTGRGGLMSYMAAAKVSWIRAVATIGGIADIAGQEAVRPEMKDFYRIMLGETKTARFERSAVEWPEQFCKTTPVLLLAGADDTRVPPEGSIELHKGLEKAGVPSKLVIYEGDDHAIPNNRKVAEEEIRNWFLTGVGLKPVNGFEPFEDEDEVCDFILSNLKVLSKLTDLGGDKTKDDVRKAQYDRAIAHVEDWKASL